MKPKPAEPKPAEVFYGRNDHQGPGKGVKKVIPTLSFRLKVYLKLILSYVSQAAGAPQKLLPDTVASNQVFAANF